MTDNTPINQRNYKLSLQDREEIMEIVKQLLKAGIVVPSCSPWNTPCMLVRRGDKARMVMDFKKVNEKTRKDSYPVPDLKDILSKLHGAAYFSTLDLYKAFHQIELDEESREYTSFSVPFFGKFQFTRVPFGLTQGTSWAQRLIDHVLQEDIFVRCIPYIDDIIIFSKSFEYQVKDIKIVFKKLKDANLSLNPEKCKFMQKKLEFLGFEITNSGIQTSPKKMHAIKDFPIPKKTKDIRSFLGMLNFHSKFISDFTQRARPLQILTGKNSKFKWTETEKSAFDDLKSAMLNPPIMSYPDFSKRFCVTTDASDVSIAATLQQEENDMLVMVDSIGRALTSAEKNYSVTERELLAIIYAFKKWRAYLLSTQEKCLVQTDHLPLCHLDKLNNCQGRLQRWMWDLAEIPHTIKYTPGRLNKLADSLSRREYLSGILFQLPKSFDSVWMRKEIYHKFLQECKEEDTAELRKQVDLSGENKGKNRVMKKNDAKSEERIAAITRNMKKQEKKLGEEEK